MSDTPSTAGQSESQKPRRKPGPKPKELPDLNGCRNMTYMRCPQCGKKNKFRRPDGTCFRCTWDDRVKE